MDPSSHTKTRSIIKRSFISVDHNKMTGSTTGRHITRNLIFCQFHCEILSCSYDVSFRDKHQVFYQEKTKELILIKVIIFACFSLEIASVQVGILHRKFWIYVYRYWKRKNKLSNRSGWQLNTKKFYWDDYKIFDPPALVLVSCISDKLNWVLLNT